MGVLIIEVAAIAISVTLNAAAFHLQNLKLYPNPFNQSYAIESITPILLEIYDITGRMMISQNLGMGHHEIDASG
tara:strand:- start:314 stop:538 length:225 start_codon:yes stop_codon:yes gene_type:complete